MKILSSVLSLSLAFGLAVPCLGLAAPAAQFFGENPLTADANVGVLVVDVHTGEVIDAYGDNRLLPTASTMKVLTTSTALELLGESFQWSTCLETDGDIVDGVLQGNLYVRGSGDPSLCSRKLASGDFLAECASQLLSLGVGKVSGQVVADLSAWNNDEAVNPGWLWEDMGNYYASGVYPLSFQDNTLHVYLASGDSASVASVLKTEPSVDGLLVESRVRCTGVKGDNAYGYGRPMDAYRLLTGEIPSNRGMFRVKLDMPDPGLVLAQQLRARLLEAGVAVDGAASSSTVPAASPRRVLFEHRSPVLSAVVAETNLNSNNLFAESVFRSLASDEAGSLAVARSRVVECWRGRGVDLSHSIIVDGSGLAPQNGLSPQNLVGVLRYMYRSPHFGDLLASLPVAGRSGTLKSFLAGSRLAGKVYAKSGTIAHLKAYAGYIFVDDKRVWAFSMVVNNAAGSNREVQKLIERYLLSLVR